MNAVFTNIRYSMALRNVPKTMRALLYNQPAQTLKVVEPWQTPKPNFEAREYVLKVDAVAITKGELTWPFPPDTYLDYSPGVEMSGTVIASPLDPQFPEGSHVFMRTTSPRSGSIREYTIAWETELATRPSNITAEEAASVPTSALTAWQALFVQAGYDPILDGSLKQSKKILIVGASGSCGLWASQLASLAGFWVAGTSHTRNVAMVQGLGAHEVIDYTKTSVQQWMKDNNAVGKFDLVLDCVGPGASLDAWCAANPHHGVVLSIVPPETGLKWTLDRPEGVSTEIDARFFIMSADGEQLQKITKLIEAGKVKPVVDSIFELQDYEKAFARVDSGKATGKVVVHI